MVYTFCQKLKKNPAKEVYLGAIAVDKITACNFNFIGLNQMDAYSDMFYFDKLHLVEKGNIVLAKSICRPMEYSHRIKTRNEFTTPYQLATVFQLSNTNFPVLLSKYVCKAVSGCTEAPSSKLLVMLLLNPFVNLFLLVNSLVYLCLLKPSITLLIVL